MDGNGSNSRIDGWRLVWNEARNRLAAFWPNRLRASSTVEVFVFWRV